ncbi:MAG TPA: tRNA pseudouridine(13) synthase TruD [Steroidobacteraceae bacterium]|nr:tRNA pseudouridine(13) synthase TruD [Steroidobacteraceae bacterium]
MNAGESVRALALAPPRAGGTPAERVRLRVVPEDFRVEEELGFAPSGSGAHLLLRVRKTDANTAWVAQQLARLAGCAPREIGYAGLKDRRAVAIQWFSVPLPRAAVGWPVDGPFAVLEAHAHSRKLPRGALAGNRFAVRLRPGDADGARLAASLAAPLARVAAHGVPNYFGPQRFGRDAANLTRSDAQLRRLPPAERGLVLSAARSLVFNAVLAERVADGSWQRLEAGDLANLDGRGSVFAVAEVDEALAARCAALEIHPTGPLWGAGEPPTAHRVLALERRIGAELAAEGARCAAAGMRQERRSLRLRVGALACEPERDAVVLHFRLTRGGFATAVLRELIAEDPGGLSGA